MPKRLTKEIVNERLSSKGYRLIGEFTRVHDLSIFECCKKHVWEARPSNIMSGKGCPICSNLTPLNKKIVNQRLSSKKLILLGNYINSKTKSLFQCNKYHTWEATVDNVMRSSGCPSCAEYEFNVNKPAILYYINVIDTDVYKIGITNRSVRRRFTDDSDYKKIRVIKEWKHDKGQTAYEHEQMILQAFKQYLYKGDNLLQSGNTETFTHNA